MRPHANGYMTLGNLALSKDNSSYSNFPYPRKRGAK